MNDTAEISAFDRVMEVYKYRQVDLANDIDIEPYKISKWAQNSGIVPAAHILDVEKAARDRDVHKKLPPRETLICMFLQEHKNKMKAKKKD